MGEHVSSRRGVAGGLACVAVGAAALLGGLAAPAGATGGPGGHGDMGDRYGGQDWNQAEVPLESGRHVLDDGGTSDSGDDVWVDMQVENGQVSWSSNREMDAAGFGEELEVFDRTGGHGGKRNGHGDWGGHGGWGDRGDRGGHGKFRFCWDKDRPEHPEQPPHSQPPHSQPPHTQPPETTPPETTPPETTPPETTPPTAPETTVTTVSPTTPTTEAPTTTTTAPEGETLPRTGSNSTVPLVLAGLALLGVGGGLVVVTRRLRAS